MSYINEFELGYVENTIRMLKGKKMPVPKKKQEKYGKIVGHLQNEGYSLEEAKNKADKAIMGKKKNKREVNRGGKRVK